MQPNSPTLSSFASSDPSEGDDPRFVQGRGTMGDSDSANAKKRRHLIETMRSLRSSGVDLHLDLPQIAVVGSQSVGKSTLIEAISGIRLPRASGTCTRCPIECNLASSDGEWRCQVTLRFTVDERGRPLNNPRNIEFGEVITDKTKVEERIRRAQMAILNPRRNPDSFLATPLSHIFAEGSLAFSSNCISVKISGVGVEDLSFVDLPGIIASVREGQDENDIKRVENLVRSHIEKPSCLILLVISCETDLENQGARRLVKEINPSGDRVIPVLTKPDRIPLFDEHRWISLLRNQVERFKHGWYCVKQPAQDEAEALTQDEARKAEVLWFKRLPWSDLDQAVKVRLGTTPLTKQLEESLFLLIAKRLPGLLVEVNKHLESTEENLELLPRHFVGDPVIEIWQMLGDFKRDVKQLVSGRPDDGKEGLLQKIKIERQIFREAIFAGAPQFKPYTELENPEKLPADSSNTNTGERLEPASPIPGTTVYINEVQDHADQSITRELPLNYPYSVKKFYIARFLKMWNKPADKLFTSVRANFESHLKNLINEQFGAYSHGGLMNEIYSLILHHLNECTETAHARMEQCIRLEQEEPMTLNEQYLADYKEKYKQRYIALRRTQTQTRFSSQIQSFIQGSHNQTYLSNALANLSHLGFQSTKDDLLRLLGPDSKVTEEALDIMAEVRAYYQVAFKRFVDHVAMVIDEELMRSFERTLERTLFLGLKLGADDASQRCAQFLKEDPFVKSKREELFARARQMKGAKFKLEMTLATAGIDPDAIEESSTPEPTPTAT